MVAQQLWWTVNCYSYYQINFTYQEKNNALIIIRFWLSVRLFYTVLGMRNTLTCGKIKY